MSKTLLKFPCIFPIKIIGLNHITLQTEVITILKQYINHFDEKDIITKSSKNKNYLSITANMNITSQKQLDDIYQHLNKIQSIKFIL